MDILITDGTKIQSQINSSQPGDTIIFGDNVVISSMVEFKSNRTYTGGWLKFTGFTNTKYGISLENACSNLIMTKMKISGAGILANKGVLNNVKIIKNEFFNIPTIYCIIFYSNSINLVIEDNYFHDYAGWGAELWGCFKGSYSWNTFINITQGVHVMNSNVFAAHHNVGVGLKRMGLEIQQTDAVADNQDNLAVNDNVFYDWNNPYWDSFGLSIMPQKMSNVNVNKNYTRMNHTGDFSTTDTSGRKRWGIGIEFGAKSGKANKNIVACNESSGPAFAVSMKTVSIEDNDIYGFNAIVYGVGRILAEPGLGPPMGSYPQVNKSNNRELPFSSCPNPPEWAVKRINNPLGERPDGSVSDVSNPTTTPIISVSAPLNLTGFVISSTQVDLIWESNSDNEKGFKIQRKTTKGGDPWITICTLGENSVSYSDKGLNPNWEYDYRLLAFNDVVESTPSNTITKQLLATDPIIPTDTVYNIPLTVFGKVLIDTNARSGFGPPEINQSNGGNHTGDGLPLTINGVKYPLGLGVCADFSSSFPLTGDTGIFQCQVGIDDETIGQGNADFIILLDDIEVIRENLKANQSAKYIQVDVTDKKKITIKVDSLGDIVGDHVDIIGPEIIKVIFRETIVTKVLKPNKFVLSYEDETNIELRE